MPSLGQAVPCQEEIPVEDKGIPVQGFIRPQVVAKPFQYRESL